MLVAQRTMYEILMLHPSATLEVINAVYRQLAKQHHPDHAGPDGQKRMAEINEAFAILNDPEKRARYDELAGVGSRPEEQVASPTRATAPGATNLKYEGGTWAVREPTEPTPAPPPYGEAGPPPRNLPSRGRVISFGRYRGWTIPQVAAYDRNYVEWLSRTMAGRTYQTELKEVLGATAR
jgi:curved DNA-binding protein CbpA